MVIVVWNLYENLIYVKLCTIFLQMKESTRILDLGHLEDDRSVIAKTFMTFVFSILLVGQATLLRYFQVYFLDAFLVQCLLQILIFGLSLLLSPPTFNKDALDIKHAFFMSLNQVGQQINNHEIFQSKKKNIFIND